MQTGRITAVALELFKSDRRHPRQSLPRPQKEVDEAAADVRVIRESQPEALDNMERRLRQLEIEIHALQRETDPSSLQRLEDARKEAANVREELEPLREHYESEKERTREIQEAKIKLDQLKNNRDEAERSSEPPDCL